MRIWGTILALTLLGSPAAMALENGLPRAAARPPIECVRGLQFEDGAASLERLHRAADQDDLVAQSLLGCMYAKGAGVERNDLTAFGYFSRIADQHADDVPDQPTARLVAHAFVALGQYHLTGIANSEVRPNPERARSMFAYAASYFGNADAQYYLACLYLGGLGSEHSPVQASRWLGLAATKGQHRAQAILGYLLFSGQAGLRQPAPGLMWLTLAMENASPDETWITDAYKTVLSQASEKEQAAALMLLERHLRGRPY
jgi:TPR repeat protein